MPKPWQVVTSTVRHEDEWLRVRSDCCITVDGRVIDPYHVLQYADWVNVVALTRDAEIVLVREYRHGAGRVLTGLVAGHVDDGESPDDAAGRELREETGCIGELHRLGSFWANPATHTNRVCSYLATGVEQVTDLDLDPNEDVAIVRRPFLDFLRDTWTGNADLQGLHLAAICLAIPYILHNGLSSCTELQDELRLNFAR